MPAIAKKTRILIFSGLAVILASAAFNFVFGPKGVSACVDCGPKLQLSSMSCQADGVLVHFVLNQLPNESITDYSSVHYIIDGVSRVARFDRNENNMAHYVDTIPVKSSGRYLVSAGYIEIAGYNVPLSNPQIYPLDCAAPPVLSGSCSGTPSNASVGEPVTWTASASGGLGSYSYSWSGTDGLSGTASSLIKTYSGAGTKNASVTIVSGSQSITKSCSVSVTAPVPPISASCSGMPSTAEIGEPVTWQASASGGTGTFSYSWSGDDNLTGNALTLQKSYATSGTKNASVTVTSGGLSVTKSCSVNVEPVLPPVGLIVSCSAAPSEGAIGEAIVWTATVLGGTGSNTYSWSGDDSLFGNSPSVSKIYSSAGTKQAAVTVQSGTLSGSAICQAVIAQTQTALSGSCSVSPATAAPGSAVTWTAQASGGNGAYTYSWSGDENLSGNAQTLQKTYANTGTKNGTVTITSDGQSVTRTCSMSVVTVPPPPPPPSGLSATCVGTPSSGPLGTTVNWSVLPAGGTGSYFYSWSGSEFLSGNGQTVQKTYGAAGTKDAMVEVDSGGASVTATCSVNIFPPPCTSNCGGGGGFEQPNVFVQKTPIIKPPPQGQVLSYVYLSQIPYTGLGDNMNIVWFILLVGLWSGAVVFAIKSPWLKRMFNKTRAELPIPVAAGAGLAENSDYGINTGDSLPAEFLEENSNNMNTDDQNYGFPDVTESADLQAAMNTAFSDMEAAQDNNKSLVIDIIAAEGQKNKAIISEDGMRLIAETGSNDPQKVLSLLSRILQKAESLYTREDGWLLLNREKVAGTIAALSQASKPAPQPQPRPVVPEKPVQPARKEFVPPTSVQSSGFVTYKRDPQSSPNSPIPNFSPEKNGRQERENLEATDTPLFINWLATGDKEKVFNYLRTVKERSGGTQEFLKQVVFDLDAVYRSRYEDLDEPMNDKIANAVSGLSNESLEKLINILLSVVDQSYKSTSTGMKLALMRVAALRKNSNR